MMKTGFSYYFGTNPIKSREVFAKATDAGMEYVFTSLHIPEEQASDYKPRILEFITACKKNDMKFMVDISPYTLEKLDCAKYEDLKALGIDYVRPDFGFTNDEIVSLSKTFFIAFNASTHSKSDYENWARQGADFSRFFASHNFYPKPLTGLPLERVREINTYLKPQGYTTMAFVAGDKEYRTPIYEGLPTVEAHRNANVFFNMLELYHETDSDVVMFGDIDVTDRVWRQVKEYNQGYISLRIDIDPAYADFKNILHHDRADSSGHIIRSVESRLTKRKVTPSEVKPRNTGDIFISNEKFLRYEGELEIARQPLEADERVNVIGRVHDDDVQYLKYIKDGFGFKLI